MNRYIKVIAMLGLGSAALYCGQASQGDKVEGFKYLLDEFADIKVTDAP